MRAVDTNVVVRFLANDDSEQSPIAAATLTSDLNWVSRTVILETQWVLSSIYNYSGQQIAAAFRLLARLPCVVVEDLNAVLLALEWHEQASTSRTRIWVHREIGLGRTPDRPKAHSTKVGDQ